MQEEKQDISALINESIRLELNVARLYDIFYRSSRDDAPFWWGLAMEEKNHASILRSCLDHFSALGGFPDDLLSPLKQLREANAAIQPLIERCDASPPSREAAFSMALKLEETAGELHYQDFMTHASDSVLGGIFQRLNRDDKDHAARIRAYMKSRGIEYRESKSETAAGPVE